MPRDSNGQYSLPPGYLAVTGQDILASQHNPPLEDLAAAMTGSLPRNGSAPMLANLPFGGFKGVNLAPGTASTDAVTKAQLDASGVPVGTILDFGGSTVPAGYLACHGQAVSRTTYAALFAAIGTLHGAGNGSTTFNVPDARGRVTAGADTSGSSILAGFYGAAARIVGTILGAASHVLTIAQTPSHNHGGATGANGGHDHRISVRSDVSVGAGGSGSAYALSGALSSTGVEAVENHAHTISSQGGGDAHPNAQPTLIVNKIIRSGI